MISFEDYIENICIKNNIKEAIKIINLIDLNRINGHKSIFHKLATLLFKNKCFPTLCSKCTKLEFLMGM